MKIIRKLSTVGLFALYQQQYLFLFGIIFLLSICTSCDEKPKRKLTAEELQKCFEQEKIDFARGVKYSCTLVIAEKKKCGSAAKYHVSCGKFLCDWHGKIEVQRRKKKIADRAAKKAIRDAENAKPKEEIPDMTLRDLTDITLDVLSPETILPALYTGRMKSDSIHGSDDDFTVIDTIVNWYVKGKKMKGFITLSGEAANDCHACAPDVSIGFFEQKDGEWSLVTYDKIGRMGAWGLIADYEIRKIGKGHSCLWFDFGFSNMGETMVSVFVYSTVNNKIQSVLELEATAHDNLGMYEDAKKVFSYETKISLATNPSNPHFDDIKTHRKGTDMDRKKVNEKVIYTFKDGTYQKKQD